MAFRPKFDYFEVALLCVVSVFLFGFGAFNYPPIQNALILAADGVSEYRLLERTYGPHRDSRMAEEWIIRDFFHDKRDGTFVDVGANDYRKESNTYYLETALGWSGIGIDAQAQFAADYQRYRPKTKFFTFFVSDTSDATATLYVAKKNSLTASANRAFTEEEDGATVERKVATITLNDLLAGEHVSHMDFVTMDIELGEPKALAGFDIERFAPALVCIEGHRTVRQAILDYFQRHHYVTVGKYLYADTQNLYFMPANQSSD